MATRHEGVVIGATRVHEEEEAAATTVVEKPKVLKPLDESNREAMEKFYASQKVKKNGVACPNCGNELVDVESTKKELENMPAQIEVRCVNMNCLFKGFRYLAA